MSKLTIYLFINKNTKATAFTGCLYYTCVIIKRNAPEKNLHVLLVYLDLKPQSAIQ